jgi:putative RNA 2'-phosphotransferase
MDYIELSKEISYALRHHPEEFNLKLDDKGYTKIDDLLDAINKSHKFSKVIKLEDINYILNTSDKKRWEIKGDFIRATYGHSIEKEIEHIEAIPPDILYHGTSHKYLNNIMVEELKPMERQFVHLSEDKSIAIQVGKRRDDDPIVLEINSRAAYEDGLKFYKENNGVWLVKSISSKYIKKL